MMKKSISVPPLFLTVLLIASTLLVLQNPESEGATNGLKYLSDNSGGRTSTSIKEEKELQGVWFSYIDWNDMPKEIGAFKKKADEVMSTIRDKGFNTIFCHVHSHSDSYYPKSTHFALSKFTSSLIKEDPSFDPIAYMIDSAHKNGLKFHAWINPYRVTGYLMEWEEVPNESIVKKWASDPDKQRNVLLLDGEYYLNPSKIEVRSYLSDAIRELTENYEIDGVQFDDYFYPLISLTDKAKTFDQLEYENSGSSKSLTQFRRDNVSELVRSVHSAVHNARPSAVFGISPVPDLESLRSDKAYFVDIDLWLKSTEYVDYIMPQIYHGFELKTGKGQDSSDAFVPSLQSWIDLKRSLNSPVKLYVGLALYKTGSNTWDGNTVPEWLRYNDILAREVIAARKTGEVEGFSVYDYMNFDDVACQAELEYLKELFS